jgi:hypothetical protein
MYNNLRRADSICNKKMFQSKLTNLKGWCPSFAGCHFHGFPTVPARVDHTLPCPLPLAGAFPLLFLMPVTWPFLGRGSGEGDGEAVGVFCFLEEAEDEESEPD